MENETRTNVSIKTEHPLVFLYSDKILNSTSCIAPDEDTGGEGLVAVSSSGYFSFVQGTMWADSYACPHSFRTKVFGELYLMAMWNFNLKGKKTKQYKQK